MILLNYASTDREQTIVRERIKHDSNRKTAEALGLPRRSVDYTMKKVLELAAADGHTGELAKPKILILDIETAPMLSYLWSLWAKYVNPDMQESTTYILSWAAKWLDADETYHDALIYNDNYTPGTEDDHRMLTNIWNLLDEAEFVVAHNGDRFDIKHLNTRFLLAGLQPPSPFKKIDTLKIVKRTFAFDSNRLDFILKQLFGYGKDDSGGFETWRQCVAGVKEAWDKLITYNIADVEKLEEVYKAIRSWDHLHPNVAVRLADGEHVNCTVCGSQNMELTDKQVQTTTGLFSVYRCGDCGATARSRRTLLEPAKRAALLVKAI
jgi:hypothetical protein